MFKKLLLSLLMATGINSAAHALTLEQFKEIADDAKYRKAAIMYLGGVNDSVKIMATWSDEDCTQWKVLSPNQLMAAFEAHYPKEDKDTLIAYWAFKYAFQHGGCADE